MKTHTCEEIAQSFKLWREYVDPSGHFNLEDFEDMSLEEKIEFQTDCFGEEEDA